MNFDDRPRDSEFPSEGRTMTQIRKERFLHIGGPYDGAPMLVEVDSDGVPVETNTIPDITAPDMLRDPGTTFQSDALTALYERVEQLGDDGFEYVFQYVFQDYTDLSGSIAA